MKFSKRSNVHHMDHDPRYSSFERWAMWDTYVNPSAEWVNKATKRHYLKRVAIDVVKEDQRVRNKNAVHVRPTL